MEKQLGLHKFHQNEKREQKFQRWRDNKENGKRLEEEMREHVKVSVQEQMDQKLSDVISSLAEDIARRKKIPVIDAMLEAQEEYVKLKR